MGCGPSHVRMDDEDHGEEDHISHPSDGEGNNSIDDYDDKRPPSTVPSQLSGSRQKSLACSDEIDIDAELEDALKMERNDNEFKEKERNGNNYQKKRIEFDEDKQNEGDENLSGNQISPENVLEGTGPISENRIHKRSIFEISLLEKADGFQFQFTKSKHNLFASEETPEASKTGTDLPGLETSQSEETPEASETGTDLPGLETVQSEETPEASETVADYPGLGTSQSEETPEASETGTDLPGLQHSRSNQSLKGKR